MKNGFNSKVKIKSLTLAVLFLLMFSMVMAAVPFGRAAGALTLSTTTATPGSAVIITGSGFGVQKPVGIALGAEVKVINETMPQFTGPWEVDIGPYYTNTAQVPIKPGSYVKYINITSTFWMAADYDDGNGTYSSPFGSLLNGTIDYVTGLITNFQTAPFYYNNTYANLANYTTYECDVTPATGVTTNPSGAFSASITVPDVYNGEYEITAIDTQGNTATAALTVVGGEDPPQLEWPMFHNDLQNTGYSESPAPDTNQTLWNFNMSAATVCSPAVVDGRVYIGDWTNKMYCLDAATGTSIWNYTANGAMTSSPAVVDGKVYVGSLDGKIYCLDAATGAEIWKYFTNAALFYGGPAVAYGVVYVGAGARVYAFGTEVIPEGITLAVMLLLSTVAVIVSIRYFRKRPKWQKW